MAFGLISIAALRTATTPPKSPEPLSWFGIAKILWKVSTAKFSSFDLISMFTICQPIFRLLVDSGTGTMTSRLLIPSRPFQTYSLLMPGTSVPSPYSSATTTDLFAKRVDSPRSVVTVIFALRWSVVCADTIRGGLRNRM